MVQPQDGDLVAAGVDREQEPAAGTDLYRALGSEAGPEPGAADRERRPGIGVSDPSACRSKAATVFEPAALSLT